MPISPFLIRTLTAGLLSFFLLLTIFYLPPFIFSLVTFCILIYILVYEWPKLWRNNQKGWLIAPLYPILPIILLITISHQYHQLIVILFATTASFDTGAYLVGSLIGHHKIAPKISPGKSWEGLLGGYVATVCTLSALAWYHGKDVSIINLLFMCTCISLCAFFGDLFESWLKRRAGIKDISGLLPGHGGFLDRLDSILFVTIFFYLFSTYLITLV